MCFKGDKERTVKIAYVVDMPIWRMSYRMVFKDDQCQLQGWAHVDNASGVDWDKIALDLRSGKPQAFHTDLFNPIAGRRKNVGTSIYEFLDDILVTQQRYQTPTLARNVPASNLPRQSKPRGGFGRGGFGGGGSFGGGGEPDSNSGVEMEEGFESTADSQQVARMVRYQLKDPISLGAGESAALPVFDQSFPAKKLV